MVMNLQELPKRKRIKQDAYRLINSKYPPIDLFDDVADPEEFDAVFAIQSLTNPRIQTEIGNMALISIEEIPFGITGCSYATSPFTHVNPDGSRFSDGSFGLLSLADTIETAIAETRFHQERFFKNVEGLHYDTVMMRGLKFNFTGNLVYFCNPELIDIYNPDPNQYHAARSFGTQGYKSKAEGFEYLSVRQKDAICWALFSPKDVHSAIQSKHYEFVFDGEKISDVREVSSLGM